MTDPYLTPAALRDRLLDGRLDIVDDDRLAPLIAEFEDLAERYRGIAYVVRAAVETPFLRCDNRVLLGHRPVVGTVVATLDAVEQSVTVDRAAGVVWLGSNVTGELSVSYSHGLAVTPELVLHACTEYVVTTAVQQMSSTSRDIISQSTDGTMVRYSTPDWGRGRPTGWTEVDRLLNNLDDYRLMVA